MCLCVCVCVCVWADHGVLVGDENGTSLSLHKGQDGSRELPQQNLQTLLLLEDETGQVQQHLGNTSRSRAVSARVECASLRQTHIHTHLIASVLQLRRLVELSVVQDDARKGQVG